MRVVILIVTLLGFFMIPPHSDRMFYSGDDDDYFAVASSIAFGEFPSFSKEYHVGVTMPFASVGPGVMAAPFVAAFSLADRAAGAEIVQGRTKENRFWSWSVAGFHFASYFYILAGCALLFAALRLRFSQIDAGIATTLIAVAGGGLLMYAFRRPVMSHAFEFFAVVSGVYLIELLLADKKLRGHAFWIGVSASFIFLTRYNNLPLAGGLGLVGAYLLARRHAEPIIPTLAKIGIPFLAIVGLFRIWPAIANGFNASDALYGGGVAERIAPSFYPPFYFERAWEILTGSDMGLIFTAPALILSAVALWFYRKKLPREHLVLASFCLLNVYLTIMWRSFGSFYGYRYFAFTAGPLLAVYLCMMIADARAKIGLWATLGASFLISIIPVLSMAANNLDSRFRFNIVTNKYGVPTLTQPVYQLDVLSALTADPFGFVATLLRQGILSLDLSNIGHEELTRLTLYFGPPLLLLLVTESIGLKRRLTNSHTQSVRLGGSS